MWLLPDLPPSTLQNGYWARLFFDWKFAHYVWIGAAILILNIILMTIAVDVLDFSGFWSSTGIVGSTFVLGYVRALLHSVRRVRDAEVRR
jgi:hypothetical protein